MSFVPVTPFADPRRAMPASAARRLDATRAAIDSIHSEQRRVERLGLELPLARCHDQLRFWRFMDSLCSIAAGPSPERDGRALSWPAA